MKTKVKGTALIILLSFLLLGDLNSQDLNDYLRIAVENNPGLKAGFYEYQAALERVPQVGALPDPQLSYGYFIEPMEHLMGDQVAEISLMQMFPWFGTLGAAKEEAALMAKAKYEEFNETKSMLKYEVKVNWYALFLIRKEISITAENIDILKTLEEIAVSRYRGGEDSSGTSSPGSSAGSTSGTAGSMQEMNMPGHSPSSTASESTAMSGMNGMQGGSKMVNVLRVQIEINELKNRLVLLKDREKTLVTQFNQLLNRDTDSEVVVPSTIPHPELTLPVSEIPENIRLNNPMLRMLEKQEEAFQAQQKRKRRMSFPTLGVGLQYAVFRSRGGDEALMDAENMLMPMITLSIPLWRKKYNASVKEAQLKGLAVVEQKQNRSNKLMVNYEEALNDFNDAERRLELYREQTQLGQQILDLLTVEYSTSGSSFEELLRMQQQLLTYRLALLDALVDGSIAAAMLERLMGR